ncbi:MAG: hypothetical protein Q8936_06715 [Bacillota bacterium]|nr:hypothetical protein [Bacillota bacterium]
MSKIQDLNIKDMNKKASKNKLPEKILKEVKISIASCNNIIN